MVIEERIKQLEDQILTLAGLTSKLADQLHKTQEQLVRALEIINDKFLK